MQKQKNINKYIFKYSRLLFIKIILLINLFGNYVLASQQDPVQFLHSITDKVLTELKHSHDEHKKINEINRIVDNYIMPNVDFEEMCQWIAGRGIWAKAAEAERTNFMNELKQLLIKTYSTALNNYTEEKIEFQHYAGDHSAKRIQIKSTVIRPNKENLSVDYRLVAKDDSWKVYDLIIEGVSILQGFRAQFSDDIKMHGLSTVTSKIKNHNNKKQIE